MHVLLNNTLVFGFESPRRILSLINDLNDRWPALHVVFAKELTKSHEAFFSGIVSEVHLLLNNTDLRGEWVFFIGLTSFGA